jgi:hypothetical protein
MAAPSFLFLFLFPLSPDRSSALPEGLKRKRNEKEGGADVEGDFDL